MNEPKSKAVSHMEAVILYRNLITVAERGDQKATHDAFIEWRRAETALPTKVRAALSCERAAHTAAVNAAFAAEITYAVALDAADAAAAYAAAVALAAGGEE